MGRASDTQHGVNAGELSTLLLGRQDLEKYAMSLFVCLNALPLTQGPWTRRPGTAYLHQTRHHDKVSRVVPFQYSVTQTYVLEFGESYIRFFTEHGILTNTAQSITSITKAAVGVVTKVAHGYSNGNRLYLSSMVGMTQLGSREVVVTNKTADTFELYDSDGNAIATTAYGTFTSGNMASIFEVTTTFAEADIADIRLTQSADVLYILHPDFPPQQLVRVSALSWTLSDITFTDGPYEATNTTATTLTPSAATGTGITITASAITGINNNTGFQTTDVGRFIRMSQGGTWGYVVITGRTNTTVVTADVLLTLTSTAAKATWRMGLWSDTTGFPAVGTFHEDRLWLAGAATSPQRLDGSKTGAYTNFSPTATDGTVADDNAVAFTLNSDDVNAIRWLSSSEKGLLAGTSRGEWQVKAASLTEAITPTNISARPSSRYGSTSAAPVNAGRAVLFVQRAARKLRELAYVFEADGFRAPDMTLLAEHITRPSLDEIVYQEQPQAIVWGRRGDGVLTGFTYERDQGVTAWHRHELGGQSDADALLVPVVESLAVVPEPEATRDELYMVVQRYINGGEKRYIEYMSKIWEVEDVQEDAFHLDCGWTTVNSPASDTVTGLWHLEGETVSVYADGTKHPDVTVANGTITLNGDFSIITLGYAYNSDGQTMPLEGGAQDGSAQGKIKRIARVGFWLIDTLGLKFGRDADNLSEIINRQWGDAFGQATPLFTGAVRKRFEGDYDLLGQVYWRADGPFPATVAAIMPQYTVSDDS